MSYKKVGIVVADIDEYKPFEDFALLNGAVSLKLFSRPAFTIKINGTDVLVVNSYVGKTNAAAFTAKLIDEGCEIILNYGLSGGISNSVIGQFSIPTKFLEYDFDLTALGYKLCEKPWQNYVYSADKTLTSKLKELYPDAVLGTAVCGDRFLSDRALADELTKNYGAVTCDMETAAIASVCETADIPFVSLRRVSDGADESVKETYRFMNINSGNVLFDCFYEFLISIL